MAIHHHDVLIIGSGAAGLTVALKLPESTDVAVLSKGTLNSASTWYAQGGVAAVLDKADSLESHVRDTHVAGAFLCHDDAVRKTVENGPAAIQWLIDLGVDFTRLDEGDGGEFGYHLTREGGHSHRRIIHAADATGMAISRTLIDTVLQRRNVTIYENRIAVDLILDEVNGETRCIGAYVHNIDTDTTDVVLAKFVVLATGGAAKVYLYTTNPDVATGDGIAMAWRAGCRVANMEFMQFHPTCLHHPGANTFLISEALRGEGGILRKKGGAELMKDRHPMGSLAPRDIVAREIDAELKRSGERCVWLDMTHLDGEFIVRRFPGIHARLTSLSIDMRREPIPVVPAAHY
ncbi:MAG: FAD-binding protein, partial [Alcanivoracaceae bacterium]|nr:FAD-binding protein [Alcanivoracaceae bacterium]